MPIILWNKLKYNGISRAISVIPRPYIKSTIPVNVTVTY